MKIESFDVSIPASAARDSSRAPDTSFGPRLMEALREVDGIQKAAESKAREVASGKGDLVDTMITMSKADLAIRFVVTVRNRAIDAYHEIMRMPL